MADREKSLVPAAVVTESSAALGMIFTVSTAVAVLPFVVAVYLTFHVPVVFVSAGAFVIFIIPSDSLIYPFQSGRVSPSVMLISFVLRRTEGSGISSSCLGTAGVVSSPIVLLSPVPIRIQRAHVLPEATVAFQE